MSLPRDKSIIICDFSQSIKSSGYLSISYDRLALTALLSFYNILNAVIKLNAVTKMGTKVNKNFDDFFLFFKKMLKTFLCVKNNMFKFEGKYLFR